ncbi:uncharacterized protein DNG_01490 [Cephalotrichum gorgonifer]|uniref:CENP-V/GFA domain-containing protein n=1 Tax=Cephalotrichum gorgonifer TaxID=2041049 RepID=A0AAE8MTB1_9PEZI|nr:uncharacterized protein DNG_01490 [Cephalotrichum gorgonifer]
MGEEETVEITSQCLCKAHVFMASVKASALPLSFMLCHCESCRHKTGCLYFSDVRWPGAADVDLSGLQKYYFSETLVDYFCGECYSPMFCKRTDPGAKAGVCTGSLSSSAPNLLEYGSHIFVGDTLDGGATPWLRKGHISGQHLRRWKGWNETSNRAGEELPPSWPEPSSLPKPEGKVLPGTTPFYCHCRGVNLLLRSAADLAMVPEGDLPWYVDPTSHKYLVTSCACELCRRSCGADMTSWTYAALTHVEFPTAAAAAGDDASPEARPFPLSATALKEAVSAKDRDPRLGTLEFYQSSPEVERYHCSRCSAQIFYVVSDRPDMVEIAVGLISHPSGARAEGLLRWDYASLADDEGRAGGWRDGLIGETRREREEWRVERGYPEVWRKVREESLKARSVVLS